VIRNNIAAGLEERKVLFSGGSPYGVGDGEDKENSFRKNSTPEGERQVSCVIGKGKEKYEKRRKRLYLLKVQN